MDAPPPVPGARLLFSLDPAVVHLNHGAFGAVPVPVQRAQQRLRDEMDANPVRFFTRGLGERLAHGRRHLASFLGADPDHTTLVTNTTTAVSVVLASLDLAAGDEIVTTDHGYGAVDLAVARACTRTGAKHVVAPVPLLATDDEIVAAVTATVRADRTRLVIVDLVTSPTARVFPAARIVAQLRTRGVPVFVDGAHAPGSLPLDVSALDADFFVGNLHKWAYAPRGTALFTVAGAWVPRIRPLVVSWADADGFPARHESLGTRDYTGWLAAPAGLFVLRSLGVSRVREHNDALAGYGQRVLAQALHADPNEVPDPGAALPMRVVPLPLRPADPQAAQDFRNHIADRSGIEVSVPFWRGQALLRICAQVYNTAQDYQRLAQALPGLLRGAG